MNDIEFNKQIYILRLRHGLTQKALCKKFNIKKIYLYQLFETEGFTNESLLDKLGEVYNNLIRDEYTLTSREKLALWAKYENDTIEDAAKTLHISNSLLRGIIKGRKTSKDTEDRIFRKTGILLEP